MSVPLFLCTLPFLLIIYLVIRKIGKVEYEGNDKVVGDRLMISILSLIETYKRIGFETISITVHSDGKVKTWSFGQRPSMVSITEFGGVVITGILLSEPNPLLYNRLVRLLAEMETYTKKTGRSGAGRKSEISERLEDSIRVLRDVVELYDRSWGLYEKFHGSYPGTVYRYTDYSDNTVYELYGDVFRMGETKVRIKNPHILLTLSDLFGSMDEQREYQDRWHIEVEDKTKENPNHHKFPNQYRRYGELQENIRIRKSQMSGHTGKDREHLQNELAVVQKKVVEMKKKYGF